MLRMPSSRTGLPRYYNIRHKRKTDSRTRRKRKKKKQALCPAVVRQ
jgi:hypothetical protein